MNHEIGPPMAVVRGEANNCTGANNYITSPTPTSGSCAPSLIPTPLDRYETVADTLPTRRDIFHTSLRLPPIPARSRETFSKLTISNERITRARTLLYLHSAQEMKVDVSFQSETMAFEIATWHSYEVFGM